ncbi:MAG TPA: hypothetical protein VFY85_01575 [Gemmatimonadaceae bacterium]|nr:hypothetical protein [Gemmatimonadaceae bacterium]
MQQSIPTPPPPPTIAGTQVQVVGVPTSPTAVYQGYVAQRSELRDQLEGLQDQRRELSRQLQDPMVTGADRTGLESHIATIDARIGVLEVQIAAADADVAKAAAVPGAVVPEPPYVRPGPPEEVFVLSGIFIVVVLFPLTIAYARRLWRRGAATVTAIPHELMDRLTRLDQAVDSIAVEVERIGEGQRFVTRVLAERPMEPIALPQRASEAAKEREPR